MEKATRAGIHRNVEIPDIVQRAINVHYENNALNYRKGVGERLTKCIEEKGIISSELAEVLGVSSRSIARYINGETVMNLEKFIRLRERYHIDLTYLILGEGTQAELKWENFNLKETGARIRSWRKDLRLSLEQTAVIFNTDERTVRRYERGQNHITPYQIFCLGYALGDLSDLNFLFMKN